MGHNVQWKLSPAYDLAFSSGVGNEQCAMVMSEGSNPDAENLLKLAEEVKIKKDHTIEIMEVTRANPGQTACTCKTVWC